MTHHDLDRAKRLRDALEAAQKAGNPTLVKSIEAAMRGESYDPFSDLNVHPEVRHLVDFDDWTD